MVGRIEIINKRSEKEKKGRKERKKNEKLKKGRKEIKEGTSG